MCYKYIRLPMFINKTFLGIHNTRKYAIDLDEKI